VSATFALAVLVAAVPAASRADQFLLGAGIDGDNADGLAFSAFGDFPLHDETWLSLTGSVAETDNDTATRRNESNRTLYADIGIDHWFKPLGIRIGASYWGNDELLDSRDLRGSIYLRGDPGSLSLEIERRDFEFDFQADQMRGRSIGFTADGVGLRARVAIGDDVSVFLSGMRYDYSRNLRLQPELVDFLGFISASRLSMINSLVDNRVSAGVEYRFGLKSVDVTAGRWQTAIDGSHIDSLGLGFNTPLTDRLDFEIRLSTDRSERFGSATALSLYLYYFGGS